MKGAILAQMSPVRYIENQLLSIRQLTYGNIIDILDGMI